jgi:hypothetical protein
MNKKREAAASLISIGLHDDSSGWGVMKKDTSALLITEVQILIHINHLKINFNFL